MEVKIKQGSEMLDAKIEMIDDVMVVSPKVEKYVPKDGDVVCLRGFYGFVFIYKENLTSEAYFYAALIVKDGKIILPDGGHIGYVSQLRPATEEEKKKLFDKLAEEGWEWKADTKELVKLKWKPMTGQWYYIPAICNTQFKVVKSEWSNDAMDVLYFGKGWAFRTKEECQEFCNRLNQAIEGIIP